MTIAAHYFLQNSMKHSIKITAQYLGATALVVVLSATCFVVAANAQSVAIPIGSQGNNNQQVPTLGMTMENVRKNFGQAEREQEPVGNPPITIWHYSNYRVYFEYTTVIHTVLVHSKPK